MSSLIGAMFFCCRYFMGPTDCKRARISPSSPLVLPYCSWSYLALVCLGLAWFALASPWLCLAVAGYCWLLWFWVPACLGVALLWLFLAVMGSCCWLFFAGPGCLCIFSSYFWPSWVWAWLLWLAALPCLLLAVAGCCFGLARCFAWLFLDF